MFTNDADAVAREPDELDQGFASNRFRIDHLRVMARPARR